MAKPLFNEPELFNQIKRERIFVPLEVWRVMYYYLGDYISFIDLLVSLYVEQNVPVPRDEAGKIIEYTNLIKMAMNKVLHPEQTGDEDMKVQSLKRVSGPLHPVVLNLFTHHIGNDAYVINLVASFYYDPNDPQPIPVNDAQKILDATRTMRGFLERLRMATSES